MVGEMRFGLIQRRGNDFTDRLDSPTSTLPYINDFKVSQPRISIPLIWSRHWSKMLDSNQH